MASPLSHPSQMFSQPIAQAEAALTGNNPATHDPHDNNSYRIIASKDSEKVISSERRRNIADQFRFVGPLLEGGSGTAPSVADVMQVASLSSVDWGDSENVSIFAQSANKPVEAVFFGNTCLEDFADIGYSGLFPHLVAECE